MQFYIRNYQADYTIMLIIIMLSSFSAVKKTDRFSLVTYNTRVKVDFHLADMHRANKDRFKAVIRELTAENRTDLCGGLVQGI